MKAELFFVVTTLGISMLIRLCFRKKGRLRRTWPHQNLLSAIGRMPGMSAEELLMLQVHILRRISGGLLHG
eukprot:12420153-Karenia_brevis.AAC.1